MACSAEMSRVGFQRGDNRFQMICLGDILVSKPCDSHRNALLDPLDAWMDMATVNLQSPKLPKLPRLSVGFGRIIKRHSL